MRRKRNIAAAFATVAGLYLAYAAAVVPLVEPRSVRAEEQFSKGSFAGAESAIQNRIRALDPFFPPGSWELQNPKILENGQAKLLFREYRNLGGGRLEITPCTVIYTPGAPNATAEEKRAKAIIMQAPEGAELLFDKPVELGRAEVGRVIGGRLRGQITVRGDGKLPGPEDDLQIVTRDLELRERQLSTPHKVQFRLGGNYGVGSEMTIGLGAGDEAPGDPTGMNLGGLESFELKRIEQLHLEPRRNSPAQMAAAPGAGNQRDGAKPAVAALTVDDNPVEVRCQGVFRFEMATRAATFHDQVDVLRLNPQGQNDQLSCSTLTIHFADKRSAADMAKLKSSSPPGLLDLAPSRLEAVGDPLVIIAPSKQMRGRGRTLEYELNTGRIAMSGQEECWMQQGINEVHCRSFQYQPGAGGTLGQIEAKGPGWLRGQMANRADQLLEAWWTDRLLVRPQEQNHVISLIEGAKLRFNQMGELAAGEIHFWLFEQPAAVQQAGGNRFVPDRMKAERNVHIASTQFSGNVELMETWFKTEAAAPIPAGRAEHRPTLDNLTMWRAVQTAAGLPPVWRRLLLTALPLPGTRAGTLGAASHFHLTGRTLRAQLLLRGQQAELAELMIEEKVRVVETTAPGSTEQRLLVTGDFVRAISPMTPAGSVSVFGKQAHFEGRGLGLTGTNLNLNRGSTRLWIDGPGQMTTPISRDMQGQPATGGMLDVRWHESMNFDGRTATFSDTVTAVAAQGNLQTESLAVQFLHPIQFGEAAAPKDPPTVEWVHCRGGVWAEGTSMQGDQQQGVQTLEAAEMHLNAQTGQIEAVGPGWINRVGQGSVNMALINNPAAGTPAAAAPVAPPPATGDTGLTCLHIRFQGPIHGNFMRRQASFHDQVQVAYGPVDQWKATLDPTRPEIVGARGAVMRCNQLGVVEMTAPPDNRPSIELEATGNAVIESSAYTARALRVSYVQDKGRIILEGDGRTDAELYRQQVVGGPSTKVAAQRIYFWPQSNRVKIDGARTLELNQLPAPVRK